MVNNKNDIIYTYSSSTTVTINGEGSSLTDDIVAHDKTVEKCDKCGEIEEIYINYNWCDNEKLDRNICRVCFTKTLDKLYGLGEDKVDKEKVLYGDK